MHSKPAPSDVVFVALDKLVKKVAESNPKFLKRDNVDLVERFYLEKRPAHRTAIDILDILAVKFSEVMKGRGAKYYSVAKELKLGEREMDNVSAIFLAMAMGKDRNEGQRWLEYMSLELKNGNDADDLAVKKSILGAWCHLGVNDLERIEKVKPEITKLKQVDGLAKLAQTLLQRMTNQQNARRVSFAEGNNRPRNSISSSATTVTSKTCLIL